MKAFSIRIHMSLIMSISASIKSIQDIMRKDVGVDGDAQRLAQLGWMFFLKIFDDRRKRTGTAPRQLQVAAAGNICAGATGPPTPKASPATRCSTSSTTPVPRLERTERRRRPARRPHPQHVRGRLQLHEVRHADAAGHQQDQRGIDFNASDDRHMFGDIYEKLLSDLQTAGNAGEYLHPARRHPVHRRAGQSPPRRNHPRPRLRHRRLPHLRHRAPAQAGRQNRGGRSERFRRASPASRRSLCRICSA